MVENTVENSLASELSKAMSQFCETVNRHQTCLANALPKRRTTQVAILTLLCGGNA